MRGLVQTAAITTIATVAAAAVDFFMERVLAN